MPKSLLPILALAVLGLVAAAPARAQTDDVLPGAPSVATVESRWLRLHVGVTTRVQWVY